MSILLSTTGVLGTVIINDLGARSFAHPVVNYVLSEEFEYHEIRNSEDLGSAIDSGHIIMTNSGDPILNSASLRLIQPEPPTAATENIVISSVDPTASDDSTQGNFVGQRWVNISTERSYMAQDVSVSSAVWKEITSVSNIEVGGQGEAIIGSGLTIGDPITENITSNTNNLSVIGLEGAIVLRINTSGNVSLTGLVPPDTDNTWVLFVVNVGGGNLDLKNNHPASVSSSRFLIGGNKTIQKNEGIAIFYDPISLRWRGVGILI